MASASVSRCRALVREPAVFLLDEPLSNLDAKLRHSVRTEIAQLHRKLGTTMIYVTHDQVEAMTLGQRIVVLKDGVIQQIDTPMALYDRPANLFVAGFLGSPAMNVLRGTLQGDAGGVTVVDGEWRAPLGQATIDPAWLQKPIAVGVRPEHLQPAAADDAHAFVARIEGIEPVGNEIFVNLSSGQHALTMRVAQALPEVGEQIRVAIHPQGLHFFNPETGARLWPAAGRQPQPCMVAGQRRHYHSCTHPCRSPPASAGQAIQQRHALRNGIAHLQISVAGLQWQYRQCQVAGHAGNRAAPRHPAARHRRPVPVLRYAATAPHAWPCRGSGCGRRFPGRDSSPSSRCSRSGGPGPAVGGPHFALAFFQPRQVAQVGLAPGQGESGLIGFIAGRERVGAANAQGARQGIAAQVQLPAVACGLRNRRAAGGLGRGERASRRQIAAHLHLHLAAEHEALQLRRNRIGIAVSQHQHHGLRPAEAAGTPPGCGPWRSARHSTASAAGQGGDIAAELGVGKDSRIRALQAQQLVAGQARISDESRGQVVRHVNEV